MSRLLLVEDDDDLRSSMRDYLELKGYEVVEAGTGDLFRRHFRGQRYDLVLLDLNLPDADGLNLLAELRQRSEAPVFIVSGRGHDGSRLAALGMGADDYIVKPFNIRELEFRVRNFLRRQRQREAAPVRRCRFDGWELDVERRTVLDPQGAPVALTRGEFNLLRCLVQAKGSVVRHNEILSELERSGSSVSQDSLTVLVSRLRRKLAEPSGQPIITNVPAVGYRLAAPVSDG